jgi:hypothetical protein
MKVLNNKFHGNLSTGIRCDNTHRRIDGRTDRYDEASRSFWRLREAPKIIAPAFYSEAYPTGH